MNEAGHGSASEANSAATSFDGPATAEPRSRSSSEPTPSLGVGEQVGRYVVLDELGRGAMGRVLRAYDPKLQREVALKEVYGKALGKDGALRLVAEARAMAKLSHPHVVGVYDVEEGAERLVVVMEYVPGQDLRAWAKAARRRWQDVLAVYRQAGAGLAAAHAVELLHRDFKPDNVLMGRDGVVKVGDFGLAKASAGASTASMISQDHDPLPVDVDLTAVGTVMGTPRYMAPEQHLAQPLTPAVDQYAFCVALWEALWGAPPFDIRGYVELAAAKLQSPPAPPKDEVPRPLAAALVRGLSPAPEDRWPSMDALLHALAWDPRVRRRRWLWGAGTVGALSLVGTAWALGAWARDERCTGAEAQLADAWGPQRRSAVEAAITGIQASFASGVWERAAVELDGYAQVWTTMHTETCEATTVRGEQSPEVMDLRMTCLHRARVELQAVTTLLADADAEVASRADQLLAGLRPLDRCADVEALRAEVEPPSPQEHDAVEQIRSLVAAAEAATAARRLPEARRAVAEAKAAVAAVAYGPVHTEVLLAEGELLEVAGEYAEAERAFAAALQSAAAQRQWAEQGIAATGLMNVVGVELKRMDEGLQHYAVALGSAHGDARREATVRTQHASVLHTQGKLDEAEAELREVLAAQEAALGPEHLDVGRTRNALGNVLADRDQDEQAMAEYQRVLALYEQHLGPEHPSVAVARNNIAAVLLSQGKYEESKQENLRALALREAALGPNHPDVAQSLGNIANLLASQGKYAESETVQRRTLAVLETLYGPDHPNVARARSVLGSALMFQGKLEEGEQAHRRALVALEAALGPKHLDVALIRASLSSALHSQGKHAEAETELRAAIAAMEEAVGRSNPTVSSLRSNLCLIFSAQGKHAEAEAECRAASEIATATLGPEHPYAVMSRHFIGRVLSAAGRHEEARELAEWVWSRGPDALAPPYRAETAFVLAQALMETRPTPDAKRRARALAQQAIEIFSGLGELGQEHAKEVRAWLEAHGGPP